MAVGVAVSVSKVAVYSRMTEVNSFYARVTADGGTISDFSALRLAVVDYKAIQSLEPSLYTFASGRKAGVQYSLVPADGSGDFSVTRSGDTAMELNANGFWQPVAANVPRYDYVGGRPMLNVEELRTNLLPRYKSFAHSDWTKSGARIEGDPTTAGAETVTGGDFESGLIGSISLGTGQTATWTLNTTNPISGAQDGLLDISVAGTTGNRPIMSIPHSSIAANKMVLLEFDYKVNSGSPVLSTYSNGSALIPLNLALTGSGKVSLLLFYQETRTACALYWSNVLCNLQLDNISVKEVTGYASPFVDSAGVNLMDGYKLVATADNGYIRLATAVTEATTYSNSIWIKRVTGTGQAYIIDTNTTDRAITLTTEWQRFEYSAAAGSTSGQIGVKLAVAGDEVLIAHAQLEAGATASSPIGGEEGSSQTRNSDVIVKTGASALIGQTEGTLYIEINKINNNIGGVMIIYDPTSAGGVTGRVVIEGSGGSILARVQNVLGSNLFGTTPISNGIHKVAIGYKQNDCVFYVDGINRGTLTSITIPPNMSSINIGAYQSGASPLNNIVNSSLIFKLRLTDAQLQALTTP